MEHQDKTLATVDLPGGQLEQLIGKPAAAWRESDLLDVVRDQDVRIVSLMHVGGDSALKALDFVPSSLAHLGDILAGGERADGSSLFAGTGIEAGASDIVLRPRLETAFLDPFAPLPTLAVLCGHVGRDGRPLEVSPDTIIRRAEARLREQGIELWALGEVEFFLGRREGESGTYGADDHGYHATAPFVFGEALRRRAMNLLASLGVPVKYGHAEVGFIEPSEAQDIVWEQHEIELALTPLARAADAVALTGWVLRNLANSEGMRCSFAPIMRKGHAGSGLHFHFSPVRDGRHLPVPMDDEALPPEARWLIGGLVQLGGALMAFGNCTEGSFIRLAQGKEAPTSVTWGRYNRKALVRVPIQAQTEDGRIVSTPTIEFRLPDGSAHQHLLLAGAAQAMILGSTTSELDAVLDRTRASHVAAGSRPVTPVPHDFPGIAAELVVHREAFEAGGVFPPKMIEAAIARLSGPQRPEASPL
jgi:glutamine synthetase